MTIEIKIPPLGESIREAVVGQWRFKNGETVQKDDVLVELETDKVTQELYSPEDGQLKITTTSGATVPIGTVIGALEVNENAPRAADQREAAPAAAAPAEKAVPQAPGERIEHRVVSPLARKVALDLGMDVLGVKGTGPSGLVTRMDVEREKAEKEQISGIGSRQSAIEKQTPGVEENAETAKCRNAEREEATAELPKRPNVKTAEQVQPPTPSTQPPAAASGESRRQTREPMTMLRKRIAERLVEAQHTAALLTTFNEVDCSAVIALRKKYKDDFEKKYGVSLGFMSFFVTAACSALQAVPRLNAQIHTDISGKSEVVQFHYVDCGVAVSTERGLMVPVIRNAEQLSLAEIERTIKDLAQRARDGKLGVEELSGGTFTITNGGVFGSLLSTPILNPPQSGILGMHKIQDRPVAVEGQVVIRPMMYLALSYDHRLVDGAEAVRFLIRVKDQIEDPERMLLDV